MLLVALSLSIAAASAAKSDRVVLAREAEAFTAKKGAWKAVEGASGRAMMVEAGEWTDHLKYTIRFPRAGTYKLWLLGRSGGDGGADEVKVFFGTPPAAGSAGYYEVRFPHGRFDWTDKMFHKTAANRKTPGVPTVEVKRAGAHDLYLVKGAEPECHAPPCQRPFPNWQVDKIVLILGDGAPPP